ncbi:hypothetical protein Y027_5873 [Burkholderia pseudomallei TSV5]|nr:hypothetical protein X948_5683 [Burkholderia pseudomallei MSHR5608]KGS16629.1 hypothetical protein X989_5909 [Burkholderia pseudomallei MSHR4378]KGS72667.1 hypothetical protein X942_6009 [Burkholderia pseudomallei MSHR5596]KGS73278.1 hypothetical protein X947_5837 [Burkholderia pseudomallei MSHR7334]KGW37913.1 hypothetical protein Y047_6151 [Burkholderia pseudomallei MSHR3016]KGX48999.1 hypothetical protein Y025_5771 [Burkholderia pseudomallei TSV32]KGX49026.1 hypothetical protein Y027_587
MAAFDKRNGKLPPRRRQSPKWPDVAFRRTSKDQLVMPQAANRKALRVAITFAMRLRSPVNCKRFFIRST